MADIKLQNFNAVFVYDESSLTCLRWKETLIRKDGRMQRSVAGKQAGCLSRGTRYSNSEPKVAIVGYGGAILRIHRIVWEMHFGTIPDNKIIDHIDGNPFNNRIENLRLADGFENAWNAKKSKRNTSGVKGVYFSNAHKKWVAEISRNKKRKYLGMFDSIADASSAVSIAREDLHKEFARHE